MDGTMKEYAAGAFYTEKLGISACITTFIKARAANPKAIAPAGCGTLLSSAV
jgi:hypothetical protein